MSDGVSKEWTSSAFSKVWSTECFIEVYVDNWCQIIIIYYYEWYVLSCSFLTVLCFIEYVYCILNYIERDSGPIDTCSITLFYFSLIGVWARESALKLMSCWLLISLLTPPLKQSCASLSMCAKYCINLLWQILCLLTHVLCILF